MGGAFTSFQNTWLVTGLFLFIVAVILFLKGKTKGSLLVLTLGGFLLRLLMTNTDPFLYDWDEQYHALVAKNLAVNPGSPMLYSDTLLPVDITRWDRNHVWLHKPPFFLWLIAISIKTFGATPFAVKFPSVLLSSLMIPALFSLMKRLANEWAAWIAALFLAAHSYSIQLVSGFRNTDHNDVIFSALILFSFWSWIKYTDTQRKRDAILTGVFVGCAVITKWMPGLLVFLPWGLWMLSKENRTQRKMWIHLLIFVFVAAAIVVPWYIHIFRSFPDVAAYEMHYMQLHFNVAIEGHEGPWYFHFDALRELLGWTVATISLPGLFLLATRDTKQKRGLYIAISVVFFFTFYSIAKTKMPLFMLPIVPFLLSGIALAADYLLNFADGKKVFAGTVLCIFALFLADPNDIIVKHSSLSELTLYRDRLIRDRQRSAWIQQHCGAGKWVIVGYPDNSRASHMFYSGQIAYRDPPTDALVSQLKDKGYSVAAIMESDFIPFGLNDNTYVKFIVLPDSLK